MPAPAKNSQSDTESQYVARKLILEKISRIMHVSQRMGDFTRQTNKGTSSSATQSHYRR